MNSMVKNVVGRRRSVVSLAMVAAIAGVVWFSAMQGVGIASADGGLGAGSQNGSANQQYQQQQEINSCIIFFIPC